MGMFRSLIAGSALLWVGALPTGAAAADYPSGTIKIVVPGGPAGASDVFARIAAESLSEELSVPVIVENRPGGAGVIGAAAVAQAEPDGYTLLFTGSDLMSLVANLRDDLPYDTATAFTPIAMTGTIYVVLAVNPGVQAATLPELIALAKEKPGSLRFATGGIASTPHIAMERFKQLADIDIEHIPYRGGGQATTAAVAGEVEIVAAAPQAIMGFSEAGQLRALAVTSPERLPTAPNLPTMVESGVSDMVATAWFGLFGPAGMSPEAAARLQSAVDAVAANPKFRERIAAIGIEAAPSLSGAAFVDYVDEDRLKWRDVIQKAGITLP